MEKILAAMNPAKTHFSAGMHALNLAKRIRASLLFLLIHTPTERPGDGLLEAATKKQLATLLEDARAECIPVEYYLIHGPFESELVNFARENRITLLVIESLPGEDGVDGAFLDRIRHRLNCRIEVVNEKTKPPERKE